LAKKQLTPEEKEKQREYMRQWLLVNGEDQRKKKEAYRIAHRAELREKQRAYQLSLTAERKESQREYLRQWWASNKEDVKPQTRQRYLANQEQRKAASREWHQAHLEEARARNREYARKNAEQRNARVRAWKLARPEHVSTINRNRRALIAAAPGRHTAADVARLYATQRGLCAGCAAALVAKGKGKYHVDHVHPLALGGSNGPENLQLLCPSCNLSKHAQHPDDWARSRGRLFA
jgi:5-methylcytosine-specific restriction endonuclease McrA